MYDEGLILNLHVYKTIKEILLLWAGMWGCVKEDQACGVKRRTSKVTQLVTWFW